jgi:hypothetical protein
MSMNVGHTSLFRRIAGAYGALDDNWARINIVLVRVAALDDSPRLPSV